MARRRFLLRFVGIVVTGIASIVAGAFVSKLIDPVGGAPIIAFGAWLLGWVKDAPDCARMRRHYADPNEPATPKPTPPPTPNA